MTPQHLQYLAKSNAATRELYFRNTRNQIRRASETFSVLTTAHKFHFPVQLKLVIGGIETELNLNFSDPHAMALLEYIGNWSAAASMRNAAWAKDMASMWPELLEATNTRPEELGF